MHSVNCPTIADLSVHPISDQLFFETGLYIFFNSSNHHSFSGAGNTTALRFSSWKQNFSTGSSIWPQFAGDISSGIIFFPLLVVTNKFCFLFFVFINIWLLLVDHTWNNLNLLFLTGKLAHRFGELVCGYPVCIISQSPFHFDCLCVFPILPHWIARFFRYQTEILVGGQSVWQSN